MQTLRPKLVTAALVAENLKGTLHGDGSIPITTLTSLDEATEGAVAFVREKSSARIAEALATSAASVLLVDADATLPPLPDKKAIIVVKNPLRALIECLPLFVEPHPTPFGVSPRAEVDPTATIGKNVSIAAFCVIGPNVEIGDNSVLHPHVVIYAGAKIGARSILHSNAVIREDCVIGADTIIQNGAVIGADGFGYVPDPELGLVSVPQIGITKLADRVEIGANSCVDRATFGTTVIGFGSKLDNFVQIGHNAQIGKHCLLCGQVGIAGSAKIGDFVVLGGSAGVSDHVVLGNNTRFAAKSVVTSNTLEKGDYGGYPVMPMQQWRRAATLFRKLPDIVKEMKLRVNEQEDK